jgi:ArsR family transcriptional regulator
MAEADFLTQLETFFMALADKTRLRLLNLMRREEICVCFFTEVLGESQPKISRHLAYLRNAGVVEARRDGKWMHYSIKRPTDEYAAQILDDVLGWLDTRRDMQQEREKYSEVCCSPELLVQIARTPMTFLAAGPESNQEADADIRFVPAHNELEDYLL